MSVSRSIVSKHYARILARWPVDRLRPEHKFQSLLRKRVDAAPVTKVQETNTAQAIAVKTPAATNPAVELKQVNALYLLLDNKFVDQYPTSEALKQPASAPTYYANLLKEVAESPERSWFSNLVRKYTGMVRMQ